MIDWTHIGELALMGMFSAGGAYAAIKTELRAMHRRLGTAERDIRYHATRIDNLLCNKGH